jgi:hypothetical protein
MGSASARTSTTAPLADTEGHGEGIFGAQVLSCDVGVDCLTEFGGLTEPLDPGAVWG